MNRTPSTDMGTVLHYSGVPTAAVLGTALDCVQHSNGHAVFTVYAANGAAEDITLMKITECETVGGTYTDVPLAAFTAIAAGANEAIEVASVQLRARMRFLKFSALGGATNDSNLVVVAQLFGASESKQNADTYIFEV